jgi:D-alanyl-D-alanine carboxypeptidase/D-alanyl-D-alanine-endopeptidase (penicillin-binding protein 4)
VLAFAVFCADLERRAALPREQMERPPGGRSYTRRAKRLQQDLIERWAAMFG